MNENWKTKLQKSFENRSISPSENLWEKIENQLDSTHKKNNYRWWYVAACALVVLGIISFSLFFRETFNKKSTEIVIEKPIENQQNKEVFTSVIAEKKPEKNKIISPNKNLATTTQITKNEENKPIISEEILSEIFPETSSEAMAEITQKQKKLSPEEELLQEIELEIRAEKLLALIETQLKEEALLKNNDIAARQLLSEVEKENIRTRIQKFLRKIEKEIDKTEIVIEEKIKSIKFL